MDFPISSMPYLGIIALNPNNIQNSELDLTLYLFGYMGRPVLHSLHELLWI